MSFQLTGSSKPVLLCMERADRNWKSQQASRAATLPPRDTITDYTCKKNKGLVAVIRVSQHPYDCQQCPCRSENRPGSQVIEARSGIARCHAGQRHSYKKTHKQRGESSQKRLPQLILTVYVFSLQFDPRLHS